MHELLIVSAVLCVLGVVAWIVLLVWAAIEDGRHQGRRDTEFSGPR